MKTIQIIQIMKTMKTIEIIATVVLLQAKRWRSAHRRCGSSSARGRVISLRRKWPASPTGPVAVTRPTWSAPPPSWPSPVCLTPTPSIPTRSSAPSSSARSRAARCSNAPVSPSNRPLRAAESIPRCPILQYYLFSRPLLPTDYLLNNTIY